MVYRAELGSTLLQSLRDPGLALAGPEAGAGGAAQNSASPWVGSRAVILTHRSLAYPAALPSQAAAFTGWSSARGTQSAVGFGGFAE